MDENKLPADQEEALLALLHSRAEVTRLKEREQLFSALLASVNSVLWAFDWQAQRMVYVSPAYERIFGRSARCCWRITTSGATASIPMTWITPRAPCRKYSSAAPSSSASTGSCGPTARCAGSATNASSASTAMPACR